MKITLEIPDSVIDQTFRQADCSYWADAFRWNGKTGRIREHNNESDDPPKFHLINALTIKTGISNLAKFAPYVFGKLIENELDGPMADVVLQYCANVVCEIDGEIKPKYG